MKHLIDLFKDDLKDFLSDWKEMGIKSVKIEFEPQDRDAINELMANTSHKVISEDETELSIMISVAPNIEIYAYTHDPISLSDADIKEEQGISQLEDDRQSNF